MIGKKINQLATELAPVSTDLTIIGDPISGVSKKITLAQLGAIFSGAVSFYTNLAGFPATGDINVIYCAKDTQKLYLWSGSAYVEVFPSQALLDTYQLRSEKGVSNGYASLDSSGKVPISQLPSSIMEYKGTWSASTNTPTLANGTGDTGDVYICNSPGSVNFGAGAITFAVGDYVIYSGSIWQRSSGAVGTVTSVALSRSGDALAITGSPITTSGTINIGFAGTGAQYIKGDGTLATFPSTIAQAERLITEVYNSTGATLTKGTIVYINGGQGNLPTVTKALATGDSTSAQTFGVVQADITNNNNGYVVVAGKLSDLDTQAYTEGTQLYLSSTTAGAWTSTKQYAPAHLVYVGIVVRSHPTQGIVEIKIQNGYELDELHNVSAQSPTNNDGIFYNSATSLWEKKSIATVLGYTPQAQLNGTGFVKASGTSISYDNSTYVTTDTFQTISASKTFSVGLSLASAGGTNQLTSFINTSSLFSGSGGSNVLGFNSANNIYFGKGLDNGGVLQWNNSAVRYYTLPDATGTIALVGGAGVGTVTSVGLSSATSGVTIGSTPITTSGTITLAIATASGSQQGLLSSTDWTTFNNKQNALTNPVTGTGTTNYLPKFTGTSTIGNSGITDDNTTVTYGSGSGLKQIYINGGGYDLILGASGGGVFGFTSTNISLVFSTTAKPLGIGTNAAQPLIFGTSAAERMRLDASGNLGLGVTPSAWARGKALEIGTIGNSIWGDVNNEITTITSNAYLNTSDLTTGWAYGITAASARYDLIAGVHKWFTAPSGTAGNAISFTQAMTLDANGNLGVGATSVNSRLQVTAAAGLSHARWTESATTIGFVGGAQGIITGHNGKFAVRGESGLVLSGQGNSADMIISSTGAATFSSSVTANGVVVLGSNSSSTPYALGTATPRFQLMNGGVYGLAGDVLTNGNTYLQSQRTDGNTSAYNLLLQPLGGSVGIGTTNPSAKLDVVGSTGIRVNEDGAGTKVLTIRSDWAGVDPAINVTTSNSLLLMTANTERMRITSGGNVGIGTTSPAAVLEVAGTSANTDFRISRTVSSSTYFYIKAPGGSPSTSTMGVNGVDVMALNASGNVGIGTTSPTTYSLAGRHLELNDAGGGYAFYHCNTTNVKSFLATNESAGLTALFTFSNHPLTFGTNNTERMRITSGGLVGIGTSSPIGRLHAITSGTNYLITAENTDTSGTNHTLFYGKANGSDKFYVLGSGTVQNATGSYTTISDIRLKENVIDATPKLEDILKLRVVNYNLISGETDKQIGFIAQEAEKVFPSLVYNFTEQSSGNIYKGFKLSILVPILVKAVQELKAELDTLKNK